MTAALPRCGTLARHCYVGIEHSLAPLQRSFVSCTIASGPVGVTVKAVCARRFLLGHGLLRRRRFGNGFADTHMVKENVQYDRRKHAHCKAVAEKDLRV